MRVIVAAVVLLSSAAFAAEHPTRCDDRYLLTCSGRTWESLSEPRLATVAEPRQHRKLCRNQCRSR
jgi:hypothetical protein